MENEIADIQVPKTEFLKTIEGQILVNKIETEQEKIQLLISMIRKLLKPDSVEMKDGIISYKELRDAFVEAKIPKDRYEQYAELLGVKAPISFSLYGDEGSLVWLSEPTGDNIEASSSNPVIPIQKKQ